MPELLEQRLHVLIVIEILGRPADFIEKALEGVVEKLAQEKNVEVKDKKFYPVKPIKKLFSVFAEIELLCTLKKLIEIVFDYMPSSVEIIEPAELRLNFNDANNLINDLAARLHQYDALGKRLRIEKSILERQLIQAKIKPVTIQMQEQLQKQMQARQARHAQVQAGQEKQAGQAQAGQEKKEEKEKIRKRKKRKNK